MLILPLRFDTAIRIGDDVVISLSQVIDPGKGPRGRKARIGIDAPAAVRVDRAEVRRRIEKFGRDGS